MSKTREDLIKFRLSKGEEAFDLARIAVEKQYWNSAASELYYTCFYYIQALFAKHEIITSTHKGVIAMFGLQFIKEGKIDLKWGKLLRDLFDKRQKGDYGDFMVLTEEEIIRLVPEVEEFIIELKKMIQESN